jgi:hypothetical protein
MPRHSETVAAPRTTTRAVGDAPDRVGRYRGIICGFLFLSTTINYEERQVLGTLGRRSRRCQPQSRLLLG